MVERVLITGASSGIGRELAYAFAAEGNNLVLVARREERLRILANELWSQYKTNCTIISVDLSGSDAVERILKALGTDHVDILVNNAGIGAIGKFCELDAVRQMEIVSINAVVPTALSRYFLPRMIARGRGGILNIASGAAFQPGPLMAVYFATKAYLLSLSEALYEEVRGTGITVTCVAPGITKTEFMDSANMDSRIVYRMGAMDATLVARIAHNAFRKHKALVVPGLRNKIGVFITPFIPNGLLRRVTAIAFLHVLRLSKSDQKNDRI